MVTTEKRAKVLKFALELERVVKDMELSNIM
jgi:hypothetical protein